MVVVCLRLVLRKVCCFKSGLFVVVEAEEVMEARFGVTLGESFK